MIKQDLIQRVVERTGLPRTKAEAAVDAIFESMKQSLVSGDRIELRGFGVFTVKPRKTRADSHDSHEVQRVDIDDDIPTRNPLRVGKPQHLPQRGLQPAALRRAHDKVHAIDALQARNRRLRRSQHTHSGQSRFFKPSPDPR